MTGFSEGLERDGCPVEGSLLTRPQGVGALRGPALDLSQWPSGLRHFQRYAYFSQSDVEDEVSHHDGAAIRGGSGARKKLTSLCAT